MELRVSRWKFRVDCVAPELSLDKCKLCLELQVIFRLAAELMVYFEREGLRVCCLRFGSLYSELVGSDLVV